MISATNALSSGPFSFSFGIEKVNLANNLTPTYGVRFLGSHNQFAGVPVPWRSNYFIEPAEDAHSFVLNTDTCHLYEMYNTSFSGGVLSEYSGGNYDLSKPFQVGQFAPAWNAAGIPAFPLILKWDYDLATGTVNHPLMFNVSHAADNYTAFVAPAGSSGGGGTCGSCIPYGTRIRLHAGWTQSGLNSQQQAVVTALKKYGAFMTDTGLPQNQIYTMIPADEDDSHYNLPDMNFTLLDFDVIKPTITGF